MHDFSIYFTDLLCFQDGLTALHRATIGKKQAIINYLLRNSANPFVQDNVSKKLLNGWVVPI